MTWQAVTDIDTPCAEEGGTEGVPEAESSEVGRTCSLMRITDVLWCLQLHVEEVERGGGGTRGGGGGGGGG
eukprot:CAMPEP_0173373350 /NCGR_PEP_ID=MMETSP1144-20121109/28438_1 /TAXON_ID=483371 /ORGANISM="non described non described, Strain CCMP2298" /LENGTH=70 /DNA_ID=CAMNT_0014325493 /DNA_START=37 /DNA_END=244 /DNA_ORIENTATION=-